MPIDSRQTARFLADASRDGRYIETLPAELRPTSRAEAYAAQAALEGFSAHPLFGWKIAATSTAGQQHINVGGPLAGRLLAEARQGIPSAYWESIKRADVAKESCARCSWPALRRGAPRCRG
jgi:hypothetical protein